MQSNTSIALIGSEVHSAQASLYKQTGSKAVFGLRRETVIAIFSSAVCRVSRLNSAHGYTHP